MKYAHFSNAAVSPFKGTKTAALAFALAVVISPMKVQAQMAVVESGPNLQQSILNQINTYTQKIQDATEYGEQATRWSETLSHYQQQLVKIQGMVMTLGMEKGLQMQEVDAQRYMVAERCGGLDMKALTQVFNIDGAGDVYKQQRQICGNIQRAQNMKYNVTVRYMRDTIPELEKVLRQVEGERNGDNSKGNVDAIASKASQIENSLSLRYQNWQSQINTYDSYIETMTNTQKSLAQAALKGRQGVLGTFVKTAALKAALEVGN